MMIDYDAPGLKNNKKSNMNVTQTLGMATAVFIVILLQPNRCTRKFSTNHVLPKI